MHSAQHDNPLADGRRNALILLVLIVLNQTLTKINLLKFFNFKIHSITGISNELQCIRSLNLLIKFKNKITFAFRFSVDFRTRWKHSRSCVVQVISFCKPRQRPSACVARRCSQGITFSRASSFDTGRRNNLISSQTPLTFKGDGKK